MEQEKLINSIHTLQKTLKFAVPEINNGGCLIFAYQMCKHLNSKNIQASIRIDSDKNEFISKDPDINHAWVYLPKYNLCFDGLEFIAWSKPYQFKLDFNPENERSVLASIRNPRIWNYSYPRIKTPIVRFLIKSLI